MSGTPTDVEMSAYVISNIINNSHYAGKVLPYMNSEYFPDQTERAIIEVIMDYYGNYNKTPSVNEVVISLKDLSYINSLDKNVVNDILGDSGYRVNSNEWLESQTEQWIKRRRISNVFSDTFNEFENGSGGDDFAHRFQNASSFQFDNSIGHSLVDDCHLRYEMYTSVQKKHQFYIEMLDKITDGGMEDGTLNCLLAGTGVGKSLVMGDIAAKQALHGKKVLVISLEMAEIKLAERIEANLMDVPVKELKRLTPNDFKFKQQLYVNKLKQNGGDVRFKQYPTRSAHAGHFRNLLIEYKNKLGITFDLIVIDYLNICASKNAPSGSNSYTEVKSIAEELRALAVEFKLPILTATQSNRDGQNSTDLTLDNVSESHGLSATVDMLVGVISHEDWEAANKILFVQLKNRYGDLNYYRRFMVGIERAKMRLFDMDIGASNELSVGPNPAITEENTKPEGPPNVDMNVIGSPLFGKKTKDLGALKT